MVVGAVFLAGVLLGSGMISQLKAPLAKLLQIIGQPQLDAYEAVYGEAEGSGGATVDYLLFVDETEWAERDRYLASHPEIESKGKTIFPNAIVVALPRSDQQVVRELEGQRFTWMLIRDRPFFFCH